MLFIVQVVVGGLQVLTHLSAWTQTLHLALGAVIFAMLSASPSRAIYAARSWRSARIRARHGRWRQRSDRRALPGATPQTTGDTIRAYIALTKPRIIELLLVTTVPAMVLATRWVPGTDWGDWGVASSGR